MASFYPRTASSRCPKDHVFHQHDADEWGRTRHQQRCCEAVDPHDSQCDEGKRKKKDNSEAVDEVVDEDTDFMVAADGEDMDVVADADADVEVEVVVVVAVEVVLAVAPGKKLKMVVL